MGDGNKDLAWFPFYVVDWLIDPKARRLSWAQRGVFIELLAYQWREGAPLPDSDGCREMLGFSEEEWISIGEPLLKLCFSGGSNKRLEIIREEQKKLRQAKVTAGRKGGRASRRPRSPSPDGGFDDNQSLSTASATLEQSLTVAEQSQSQSKEQGGDPLSPPSPPPLELVSEKTKPKKKSASKKRKSPKKKPHPTVGKLEWDTKKLEFGKGRQALREAINDRYLRSHGEQWITTVYRGMREKLTWQPEMIQDKESQWMFVLNWYQRAAQDKADKEARWKQQKG